MEYARTPKEETRPIIIQKQEPYEYTVSYVPVETRKKIYFSDKELTHLTIAALLVVGIGLSLGLLSDTSYIALIAFAAILTASFLLHEIAHKIVAQREGLWAEFRLTLFGAVLTLISIITPLFKIISPGAVMIAGMADRKRAGKISIAGPATNMALSTVFLALAYGFPHIWILALAAFFNAWMALFNLIPFGILDGFKIFTWDKKSWILAFSISIILLILSYQQLNVPLF
jgi:Zn-dependent protease